MPGVQWYNNTTEINPGPFRIKGGKKTKKNKKGGQVVLGNDIPYNWASRLNCYDRSSSKWRSHCVEKQNVYVRAAIRDLQNKQHDVLTFNAKGIYEIPVYCSGEIVTINNRKARVRINRNDVEQLLNPENYYRFKPDEIDNKTLLVSDPYGDDAKKNEEYRNLMLNGGKGPSGNERESLEIEQPIGELYWNGVKSSGKKSKSKKIKKTRGGSGFQTYPSYCDGKENWSQCGITSTVCNTGGKKKRTKGGSSSGFQTYPSYCDGKENWSQCGIISTVCNTGGKTKSKKKNSKQKYQKKKQII